jgi:hypothetical protein
MKHRGEKVVTLLNESMRREGDVSRREDEVSRLKVKLSAREKELSTRENEISIYQNQVSARENEVSVRNDRISTLEKSVAGREEQVRRDEKLLAKKSRKWEEKILEECDHPEYWWSQHKGSANCSFCNVYLRNKYLACPDCDTVSCWRCKKEYYAE